MSLSAASNFIVNGKTVPASGVLYVVADSVAQIALQSPANVVAAKVELSCPLSSEFLPPFVFNTNTWIGSFRLPSVESTLNVKVTVYDSNGETAQSLFSLAIVKSGQVAVQAFGAKGDGLTDDSTAFQAACNALAGTGVALYVPAGAYAVATAPDPGTVKIVFGAGAVFTGAGAPSMRALVSVDTLPLDVNSLVSSRHDWPETANQQWSSLYSHNYLYESTTLGVCTWVNQGGNAATYGISAQEFVCPAGCTSVTAGFSAIQDSVHTPGSVTWGIHDGSAWVATTSFTPSASLIAEQLTATGLTPGNRYYLVIQANNPAQAPFLMTVPYVIPNGASGLFATSIGFKRLRVDATDYHRSTTPDTWHASGYVQTASALSFVEYITDARSMALHLYCDLGYISAGVRIDIDGSFYQYAVPSVNPGASVATVNLPYGLKRVRITIGSQAWNAGRTAITGTWLRAIYWPLGAVVQAAPRRRRNGRRVLFYGDSITVQTTGNFAAGACVGDRSGPGLLAAKGSLDAAFAAFGSRALADDVTTQAQANALVQKWIECHPTDVYLAIGANDYLRPTVVASTFQTYYGYLLTAINAYLPECRVWAQSPLPEVTETANGLGSTLPNYRTAISTAVGSAKATFVDGTSFSITASTDNIGDGIHPNDIGHAKWAAGIAGAIGVAP